MVPGGEIEDFPRTVVEEGLVTPRRIPIEDLGSFHGEIPESSQPLAPDVVARVLKPEAKSEDEAPERSPGSPWNRRSRRLEAMRS